MNKLDCYNKDTVIKSLSSIFDIEEEVILSTVQTLRRENEKEMYKEFIKLLNYNQKPKWDITYYYHVTRIFDIRDFDKGLILRTFSTEFINMHINKLQEEAKSNPITTSDLFENYNPGCVPALRNRDKISDIGLWMFLNLDLATNNNNNDHKYHLAPEYVEDFISTFDSTIKPKVWELYYQKTIAFYFKIEIKRSNLSDIQHALFYLWHKVANEDCDFSNRCYCSEEMIPVSSIVEHGKIDFDVYKFFEERNNNVKDKFDIEINVIKPSDLI